MTPEDRKRRRLLVSVGITAFLIVATTLSTAAYKTRTMRFDPQEWNGGRAQYTTDNKRLLMRDEVASRLTDSRWSKDQVKALLGSPDDPISITRPDGVVTSPPTTPSPQWAFCLGVLPKSMMRERRIALLEVDFDPSGHVINAYVYETDYPKGSTLGPPLIAPTRSKAAVGKPLRVKVKP